jgi:DNA-binding XRE family transcriptional regulator
VSKLTELRKEKMLTQQELASKAGISITTVSRLENGQVKASLRTIRALAPVFDMGVEEMQKLLAEK